MGSKPITVSSAAITGSGGLDYKGVSGFSLIYGSYSSALNLTSPNSYKGGTTIDSGELLVTNSRANHFLKKPSLARSFRGW